MDIIAIDPNFTPKTLPADMQAEFHSVTEAPFCIEGLPFRKNGEFYRLDDRLREDQVNPGVPELAHHTAGGAVRFITDSPFLLLHAKLSYSCDWNHMPRTGAGGADLYVGSGKEKFFAGVLQPGYRAEEAEGFFDLTPLKESLREITVNFPLYGGLRDLVIGVRPGSRLLAPAPHALPHPVCFYGSSITQGGCASRPGNTYCAHLCRALDAEQWNLGFSGSGKGEIEIGEMIARHPLSLFVFDYDHNTPNPEHLRQTHEAFFLRIREAQKDLPVIFLSRCDIYSWKTSYSDDCICRDIIRQTQARAVVRGDRKTAFIDGEELFGADASRGECTVDGIHPNDLGFFRMYQRILPVARQLLSI